MSESPSKQQTNVEVVETARNEEGNLTPENTPLKQDSPVISPVKSPAKSPAKQPSCKISSPTKLNLTVPDCQNDSLKCEEDNVNQSESKPTHDEAIHLHPVDLNGSANKISDHTNGHEIHESNQNGVHVEVPNHMDIEKDNTKTPTKKGKGTTSAKKQTVEKVPKSSATKSAKKEEVSKDEVHSSPKTEKKTTKRSNTSEKKTKPTQSPKLSPKKKDRSISKEEFEKYANMLNTKKARTKK